jgi:uncharacterized membrane protein
MMTIISLKNKSIHQNSVIMIRKISLYILAIFYFVAGVNHFINPANYFPLIPDYLGSAEILNLLAGAAEVLGAIGLLIPATRKIAALGIILLLIAFIPSHTYFISIGSCIERGLCVPEWVAWVRLILIHPLLILWAWIYTRKN